MFQLKTGQIVYFLEGIVDISANKKDDCTDEKMSLNSPAKS